MINRAFPQTTLLIDVSKSRLFASPVRHVLATEKNVPPILAPPISEVPKFQAVSAQEGWGTGRHSQQTQP